MKAVLILLIEEKNNRRGKKAVLGYITLLFFQSKTEKKDGSTVGNTAITGKSSKIHFE